MTNNTVLDNSTGLTWRKSSYSGGEQGQCVEIAEAAQAVYVRDSKNPGGPLLSFTPVEFTAFARFAAASAI